MAKVSLLVLTRSTSIGKAGAEEIFQKIAAKKLVDDKLYVAVGQHLWSFFSKTKDSPFRFIANYYYWAHKLNPKLDVRILISTIKNQSSIDSLCSPSRNYENILSDSDSLPEASNTVPIVNLDVKGSEYDSNLSYFLPLDGCEITGSPGQYGSIVIGGTFDRLHNGHKILLSISGLLTSKHFTCGVTEGAMLEKKSLHELIDPVEKRIQECQEFLSDIDPSLTQHFEPIQDPYGPSTRDPDIEAIIASKETARGADSVNQKRKEKGLSTLKAHIIDLAEDQCSEDHKISSSTYRRHSVLGSLLRPPTKEAGKGPYVIGLSGGIASGKTSITKYLEEAGAHIVNCDLLGHQAYLPGTNGYVKIIEAFGEDVVAPETKMIDRKALGGKVFGSETKRHELEGIVWPEIKRLANENIETAVISGKKVVVVEAAVLLEAGWDSFVNEVWMCMVPREEAISRLQSRNSMPAEVAEKRLDAQLPNSYRVSKANVVFCSLWEYAETRSQVERAWKELQERLPKE